MDKLGKELAKLEAEFADPGLYARDPARFDLISQKVASKRDDLAKAEEEWLRLEMLREEYDAD